MLASQRPVSAFFVRLAICASIVLSSEFPATPAVQAFQPPDAARPAGQGRDQQPGQNGSHQPAALVSASSTLTETIPPPETETGTPAHAALRPRQSSARRSNE